MKKNPWKRTRMAFNCPLGKIAKNKISCNDFLSSSFTLFLKYKIKNILRCMVRLRNKAKQTASSPQLDLTATASPQCQLETGKATSIAQSKIFIFHFHTDSTEKISVSLSLSAVHLICLSVYLSLSHLFV